MNDIMQGLNDRQKEAVTCTEGPLLVLAGAGSGKTTVLTRRVAYILENNLAKPWQILAITFTNKAAAEMKERIAAMVPEADDIWVRTFHSCCVRILRRDIASIGYDSSFNIYDASDQKRIVKECIKDCGLNEENYPVKSIISIISDCKNKDISPEEFASKNSFSYREKQIARLYEEYEKN